MDRKSLLLVLIALIVLGGIILYLRQQFDIAQDNRYYHVTEWEDNNTPRMIPEATYDSVYYYRIDAKPEYNIMVMRCSEKDYVTIHYDDSSREYNHTFDVHVTPIDKYLQDQESILVHFINLYENENAASYLYIQHPDGTLSISRQPGNREYFLKKN